MEQSPTSGADSLSAAEDIYRLLYSSKVHYCVHKSLQLAHAITSHLTSLSFHLVPGLPSGLFPKINRQDCTLK
jgi:hypothetical protein